MKDYLFKIKGETNKKIQVEGKNTRTALIKLLKVLGDDEVNMIEEISIYELDIVGFVVGRNKNE